MDWALFAEKTSIGPQSIAPEVVTVTHLNRCRRRLPGLSARICIGRLAESRQERYEQSYLQLTRKASQTGPWSLKSEGLKCIWPHLGRMRAAGLRCKGPPKGRRVALHWLQGQGLLCGGEVSRHRWMADPCAWRVLGEGSGTLFEKEKRAHNLVDHSLAAIRGADADGLGSRLRGRESLSGKRKSTDGRLFPQVAASHVAASLGSSFPK